MPDSSRRFTDREVALVLRKAADIEEATGGGTSGGLSLRDLEDIAKEVGISPEAVTRAVEGLERGGARVPSFLRTPLQRRAVHAVAGELNEEGLARLVRHVDDSTDANGVVSQALGSVRWTSADRMRSLQVTITPERGETRIQVQEKIAARVARVVHILPTAWATMIGGTILVGGLRGGGASPSTAILAALASIVTGAGIGHGVWTLLSRASARRVARLAAGLSREAEEAAHRGLVETSGDERV